MRVERGCAVLFPGQGVSVARSREHVAAALPALLERAGELIGEDCFELAGEATRYAQPAIFLSSLASFLELEDPDTAVAFAGHSLGELSALAAAGALSHEDALELVVLRGALMDESGRSSGDGTMLALLKSTPEAAAEVAQAAGVWVANDNAPGQTVLAGGRDGLKEAASIARERGIRALPLDVTGAFHSPWMAAAQPPFREALDRAEFHKPAVTVFSGMTAAPFSDFREQLAGALTAPVRWRETMVAMAAHGASSFIDVGPDAVLARLVSRNVEDATALSLEEDRVGNA
ncbi:MAG TPA: ACP S-malonyltransferase [Solirubrobacteraceae bacterium]|nr:ACP S-malonyltransferase [Solirubrobacteraceae bacterium]